MTDKSSLGRRVCRVETTRLDDDGGVLPLRVIDESWRGRPGGGPPPEWVSGLWSLDAAVRNAVAGGWKAEEIEHEIAQLVRSYA